MAHFFPRTLDWQRRPSWTPCQTRSPVLLAFLHKWQMGFQLLFFFYLAFFLLTGFLQRPTLTREVFLLQNGASLPFHKAFLLHRRPFTFSPGHVVYTGKALDLAARLSYPGRSILLGSWKDLLLVLSSRNHINLLICYKIFLVRRSSFHERQAEGLYPLRSRH